MILHFPDPTALRAVLCSGIIPTSVSDAAAWAGFPADGSTLVKPRKQLSRRVLTELGRLGCTQLSADLTLDQEVCCWPQLLNLTPEKESSEVAGRVVLFELPDEQQFAQLVAEMLRLGNDRQSFRVVEYPHGSSFLLRVVDPPYYSLLQVIDQTDLGQRSQAYVEQSEGVWTRLGFRHPLADQIRPPAGQWLLMRPPRDWTFVPEGPFQDLFTAVEFVVPAPELPCQDRPLREKIQVPLLLIKGQGGAAEMWVLRDNPIRQIEQLLQNADDSLVARLAFAVTEQDGQTVVLLRVNRSKLPPPALVLEGIGYAPYLKLPGLFLPTTARLHPPLRRDLAARMFVQDTSRVTWLSPEANGGFRPCSLPETSFRPLSDWVDYILDRDHEALEAWNASHRFEFETFVCMGDRTNRPRKSDKPVRNKTTPSQSVRLNQEIEDNEQDKQFPEVKLAPIVPVREFEPDVQRAKILKQLREREGLFLKKETPPTGSEWNALWVELAGLYASLEHWRDACICWSNAVWDEADLSEPVADHWQQCVQAAAGVKSLTNQAFKKLLQTTQPSVSQSALVATILISAAARPKPPAEISRHLALLISSLLRSEGVLPVRMVWLAWVAVSRLSGDDYLALARARDRLLERLFDQGLQADVDLPNFLRIGGAAAIDHIRGLRDKLVQLEYLFHAWIVEPVAGANPRTRAYAALTCAYGLARLGEQSEARYRLEEIHTGFGKDDAVHRWLCAAYSARVEQVLLGRSGGQLPDELLNSLDRMDRMQRYKVDRVRLESRILEPHERVNPYRQWHKHYTTDISQQLGLLTDIRDSGVLREQVQNLLQASKKGSATSEVDVVLAALELGPRLGATIASQVLDRVEPLLKNCSDALQKGLLLGRAIYVSAHFGNSEAAWRFSEQYERALPNIVDEYFTLAIKYHPGNKARVDTIESLFAHSFRSLRRLGLGDTMLGPSERIATLVRDRLAQQRGPSRKQPQETDRVRPLRLLALVAGVWFCYRRHEQAMSVADEIRHVLFEGDLSSVEQKDLAIAYLGAVGLAQNQIAVARVQELFEFQGSRRRLVRVEDALTTSSHLSVSQLSVVEAAVRALVGDDAQQNMGSNRWLEEDEFLVRKRIHQDVNDVLARSS